MRSHSLGRALLLWCLPLLLLASPLRAATLRGDLNGDGKVSIVDVVRCLELVAGTVPLTPELTSAADVAPPPSGDGQVGVADLVRLLRYVAGLVSDADFFPPAVKTHGLTKLFFLHHSTGAGIIGGGVREYITDYNRAQGTSYVFWDHGYNGEGLFGANGQSMNRDYAIPDDNTDPIGLYNLWTSSRADCVKCRETILTNHEVIAFKSCFPASAIGSASDLSQYKSWYRAIREFCDTRPDRLFVVMSTPPLHRLSTDKASAKRARDFANWLGSDEYLAGHPNVRYFNLFDALAEPDGTSATANMLKYTYEGSHTDSDSHPNIAGNRAVAPLFAQFLCEAASVY
ncbi:MAG TPA: dockerin type I repeat-containing protein [Armatimonadota bacterium]